ncbi:MAG: prohibitin family protein [Methanomassiliicoccaceae archaeon]|jgi:regulator of protease activity HflC (stomatin/prohibitin superfamily)|nr:prohibitin family protein [Methanomassiliicoccaceae archaeon]
MNRLFLLAGIAGIALLATSCIMGVIVFAVGAVLVIVTVIYGILELIRDGSKPLLMLGGVGAMTLLVLTSMSVITIEAGQVGVVTNAADGDLKGTMLENGWHFNPSFILSTVETIRCNTQVTEYVGQDKIDDLSGSVMVMSKDQMYIFIDMSVSYSISPGDAKNVRFTYGSDWKTVVVHQVVRSVPRSICADYDALDIVGTKRAQIETAILQKITDDIQTKGGLHTGVNVVDVKIREMRIPQGLQAAVEQKLIANQLLEKAQIDLERIKVEADAEAQRKIIEAEADAEVVMIRAQATADAINMVLQEFVDSGGDVDMTAYLSYLYIQALTDPNSNIKYVIVPNDGTGVFVTLT